jgi:hydrogenase maturation protease
VSAARTLLVGLGNPILGDDGIGVRLARDVAAQCREGGLEVLVDGPSAGLDLVERLAGYARVILVDAFEAPALEPGTLLRMDAGALGPAAAVSHVHATELATALELGRGAGLPLPAAAEIHVLGIATRAADSFSERLSPELELAYRGLLEAVTREAGALCRREPIATGVESVSGGGDVPGGGGERWKTTG